MIVWHDAEQSLPECNGPDLLFHSRTGHIYVGWLTRQGGKQWWYKKYDNGYLAPYHITHWAALNYPEGDEDERG